MPRLKRVELFGDFEGWCQYGDYLYSPEGVNHTRTSIFVGEFLYKNHQARMITCEIRQWVNMLERLKVGNDENLLDNLYIALEKKTQGDESPAPTYSDKRHR